MFDSFKDTVKDFSEDLKSSITEKELTEEELDPLLEDMRLKLLKNNVALQTAERIQESVKENLEGQQVKRTKTDAAVREAFRNALEERLRSDFDLDSRLEQAGDPPVVFMVGFNGSGKTTTTAKLGKKLMDEGHEVVFGAGDTFRAASIEQLKEWGDQMNVKVVSQDYESDPAAVGYDTIEHAEKEGKIALVDTAGRSHGDRNLMDELEKMFEVNEPDISFLVVDALTGNDALEQVEAYDGMFDAFIVTKMDVDDSGGVALTLAEASDKPVAFLGTGQDLQDLEKFEVEDFVDQLLN